MSTVFREDVRLALPYLETVTQNKYWYEGVLIDEERISGLEVRSLFVFFFFFDGDCVEMTYFLLLRRAKKMKSRLLLLIFTFKFPGE